MQPADGAKITVAGTITFAKTSSAYLYALVFSARITQLPLAEGPLFTIDGTDITFDGAGKTAFDVSVAFLGTTRYEAHNHVGSRR